jgi:hypothetical protein
MRKIAHATESEPTNSATAMVALGDGEQAEAADDVGSRRELCSISTSAFAAFAAGPPASSVTAASYACSGVGGVYSSRIGLGE